MPFDLSQGSYFVLNLGGFFKNLNWIMGIIYAMYLLLSK